MIIVECVVEDAEHALRWDGVGRVSEYGAQHIDIREKAGRLPSFPRHHDPREQFKCVLSLVVQAQSPWLDLANEAKVDSR